MHPALTYLLFGRETDIRKQNIFTLTNSNSDKIILMQQTPLQASSLKIDEHFDNEHYQMQETHNNCVKLKKCNTNLYQVKMGQCMRCCKT